MKKNNTLLKLISVVMLFSLNHLHYNCIAATTYYSALNGGTWNSSSTWSTITYGSGVNSGTYPVSGDIVYIGDGYTINITTSCGASAITIGQGTSGILQFSGAGTFTLTVSGNLTINTGGKFWYNSNNSRTQNMFISGNIINNGTLDFYYDSNDRVNITFNSGTNSIVSGNGTWFLNDVTLTKSTLRTYYLEIQSADFEQAIANLSLTFGTYIHNNSGSYTINASGGSFTIDANVIFKVMQGIVYFSPSSHYMYLYGSLYVSGGEVYIGSTSGNNGLRFNKTGSASPHFEITGGSVTIYGGISYQSGAGSDPFEFIMSDGSLLLNCGTSGTSVEPFYITDVTGSAFTMSGGTIIIQSPNTGGGSNFTDFGICGANGTNSVTGGIVQFGNSNTGNNKTFNFTPFAGSVLPHIKVAGPAANSITLCPSKSSTEDFKFLSLYIDVGKIFDVRSIQGVNGDTKTMTLTGTSDNENALINHGTFNARSGTVTFNTIGSQALAGNSTTEFYNLNINNSSDITLNSPVNIGNLLTLTEGRLISTSVNIVTCLSGASSNIGTNTSYIDGPFNQIVASTSPVVINLPIGTDGNYHPLMLSVQHTNTTSVSYSAYMINNSATSLGYALPFTLSKVSDVRYYSISRQPVANLATAYLKIFYYEDDGVDDCLNLRVAQDDGASNWVNLSGTGTANTTGTITSTVFTTFNNWFTLANAVGGMNPLPIELLSFKASEVDNLVKLVWETASETNIDYYTVERSCDQKNFIPISRTKANGFGFTKKIYQTTDAPDLSQPVYYRLIITDRNGLSELSKTIRLVHQTESGMHIFPIPSDGKKIHIRLKETDIFDGSLRAFNFSGKAIPLTFEYHFENNEIIFDLNEKIKDGENTFLVQVGTYERDYCKIITVINK